MKHSEAGETGELWFSASEAETNTRKRCPTKAKRPRSAITSGNQLFIDGDPKSPWSRRFHDLIIGHISDISAGAGANALSNAQLCLVRKAAAIECELERLDAMLSRGEEVDMDSYARVSGHLRRLWETLGLERSQRDVTQSVDDLIKEEAARTRHQDIIHQAITRQDIANDLVAATD